MTNPETTPDVVAELAWWRKHFDEPKEILDVLQRTSDEIVALRAERNRTGQFVDRVKHLVAATRAEALEEAANACARLDMFVAATAIRALKDKL